MKILGGKLRGRNFYMPADIRPTQNIARKAVFDIIGQDMSEMTFLELFAGSGAMGLEAASRGAKSVTFVEKDSKCVATIRENLHVLGLSTKTEPVDKYEVIMLDAFAAIKRMSQVERKYDVIFLDPPFNRGLAKKGLKTLEAYDIVARNCLVVLQCSRRESLPEESERFSLIKHKKYGVSQLAIYEG